MHNMYIASYLLKDTSLQCTAYNRWYDYDSQCLSGSQYGMVGYFYHRYADS